MCSTVWVSLLLPVFGVWVFPFLLDFLFFGHWHIIHRHVTLLHLSHSKHFRLDANDFVLGSRCGHVLHLANFCFSLFSGLFLNPTVAPTTLCVYPCTHATSSLCGWWSFVSARFLSSLSCSFFLILLLSSYAGLDCCRIAVHLTWNCSRPCSTWMPNCFAFTCFRSFLFAFYHLALHSHCSMHCCLPWLRMSLRI